MPTIYLNDKQKKENHSTMKTVLVLAVLLSLFAIAECFVTTVPIGAYQTVNRLANSCVKMKHWKGTLKKTTRKKLRKFNLGQVCIQMKKKYCTIAPTKPKPTAGLAAQDTDND
ncbi:uncharacterized protein [Montipora foliosa]|uniref:uncharacterized protein n=1 Tax=Montipora foliosa TaxID=591990 RepID=UPI0035F1623A